MSKEKAKELLKNNKVRAALVALALALAEILGPDELHIVTKIIELIG